MRYVMLIYGDQSVYEGMSKIDQEEEYRRYEAFGAEAQQRGLKPQGEELQPVSTATTVRVRDGKAVTTDGPFAETKEQLGGFYVLNCKDLDEAIEMAAKIPGARFGSIEIRPVVEYGE